MNGEYRINFIKLREIWRDPNISRAEKLILVDVLLYAGTHNRAFPSQAAIGKGLNFSTEWVNKKIQHLGKRGLLTWKRGKDGMSNKYAINPDLYNSSSQASSATVHNPIRSPVQSNVVNESSHLISSQHQLIKEFEKGNRTPISKRETSLLLELVQTYGEVEVARAIEVSIKRVKQYNSNYLRKILEDWKKNGTPLPKPIFKPCGNCDGGWLESSTKGNVKVCRCKLSFDELKRKWTEDNPSRI